VKILGIEADNPFSLFLILILLLAASGSFDPKSVQAELDEAGSQDRQKRPLWQTRPARPLFQTKQSNWGILRGTSPVRRVYVRRELTLPFARVMPLGR
jgi:hypothetical protein